MKYLITLLFLTKLLNASMFYPAANICIEDFYTKYATLYYQKSDNMTWYVTNSTNQVQYILPNFTFNNVTMECRPNASYILGMQETEYNFLLGLMGVIIGGVFMFFLVNAFISVGRGR